ncbi:MAG: ROK family protein, partial [Verrucomicrobiales bacterium]|nr:ROK family protein [Verrucomicrobiales bacterium]
MSKKAKSSNSAGPVRVGLDLGGTKILAKIFDEEYRELGKAKVKTEGHRGVQSGLKRMGRTIKDALDEAGVKKKQVLTIGVGCPGPIDPVNGILVEAPNLGWKNAPVAEFLGAEFDAPTVICNDVDAGVFAEFEMGAARDSKCVVGIFPGTGIGAGAVVDGQLLHGSGLSCMELGHIPLYPESGGGGSTLETECSRLKIAAESARAAYRGLAPNLLETCGTE